MEVKKFYVYIHKDPRDGTIRYVGKGTGCRAWRLKRRSGKHKSWIVSLKKKDLVPQIEILEYFESEQDALDKEKQLISYFLTVEPKFCNMLLGGIGASAGENHPMYGRKHSEETKRKMSVSHKGKRKTREWADKIGAAHKGMKRTPEAIAARILKVNKPVICVENGNIFKSVKEASETTGIDMSSIVRMCKGKQKTSAIGLSFKYLDQV